MAALRRAGNDDSRRTPLDKPERIFIERFADIQNGQPVPSSAVFVPLEDGVYADDPLLRESKTGRQTGFSLHEEIRFERLQKARDKFFRGRPPEWPVEVTRRGSCETAE